ncbi:MAG: tRNA (adenosine(37)-N6)-threonylcarbamoyltransferase complex transferase subunit TsaD [Acholeplasmataceae bacterium]
MIILSVETSCDETSVAVTKDGKEVLSNAVLSQINIHEKFGGVVPEVASRAHIEYMLHIFDQAIKEAKIKIKDIDLVAVTKGPGLIGSLLVGINAATTFAYANNLPIIGVNHLIGHIYAALIDDEFIFPALVLLVSGGHTETLLIKDHFEIELIGTTLDDAVGEAYDKVARLLGLAYPGGPIIDKLAQLGKPIYDLPRPMLHSKDDNFSFSGLKSAVLYLLKDLEKENIKYKNEDIACSFQEAVTDVLVKKTKDLAKRLKVNQVIVVGGVAANSGLRTKLSKEIKDLPIILPKIKYCTDQAAMIGIAAYYQYLKYGTKNLYNLNGEPGLKINTI